MYRISVVKVPLVSTPYLLTIDKSEALFRTIYMSVFQYCFVGFCFFVTIRNSAQGELSTVRLLKSNEALKTAN